MRDYCNYYRRFNKLLYQPVSMMLVMFRLPNVKRSKIILEGFQIQNKDQRKPGNIASRNILSQCCSQCCMGKQTGRKQKLGRKFCFFKLCCLGTQTRKQSGNIRSQCFFGVSQVILCLRQQATYVEDTKFAS